MTYGFQQHLLYWLRAQPANISVILGERNKEARIFMDTPGSDNIQKYRYVLQKYLARIWQMKPAQLILRSLKKEDPCESQLLS